MRKMKTKIKYSVIFLLGFLLICFSSCSREELETPSPFGPAGFAILVEMSANPNVLVAGNKRQTSIVTTTVTSSDGEPLANRKLVFEVRDWRNNRTTDLGYFAGYQGVITAITNSNGVISLVFYGPLKNDLSSERKTVYVWATLVHHGREVIVEVTSIALIREE